MTLIAAGRTHDGNVVMLGDRYAGGIDYVEIDHPKVFDLRTPNGVQFAMGFSGSARVAQLAVSVPFPEYDTEEASLHWWLTELCDRIGRRLENHHGLTHADAGTVTRGHSEILVAIDGTVAGIGPELSWERPARGWMSAGCAFETFNGAVAMARSYVPQHAGFEDAARLAWPVAQRFHHVGPIAEEVRVTRDA